MRAHSGLESLRGKSALSRKSAARFNARPIAHGNMRYAFGGWPPKEDLRRLGFTRFHDIITAERLLCRVRNASPLTRQPASDAQLYHEIMRIHDIITLI
jgi:hypothetical protein